eukprot:TRINITY_DN861_c0_g1_i1.p1 TRINITY_DN861_c0_g1~~TRINITY_DN861_c0_g1_i1.p1  ORF type:complete len:180 (+),score=72.36 TRINITY_DN861_c0_g1_i1:229-768(+)
MGCGEQKDEKAAEGEAPAEAPAEETPAEADSSDDEEGDFDICVGVRIIKEETNFLFRLDFKLDPCKKVKHVRRMVNHVLKLNEESIGHLMTIEQLIPTWTPDWEPFPNHKKLKKVLKHSTNSAGEDFNALTGAEEGADIYLVGADTDQFEPGYWNEHLDFRADEFVVVECGEDFSDDSD